jgi:hypothetical protein
MKLIEFIQLDNLDSSLTELKHYRPIPAYQQAKTLFTDTPRRRHYDAMEKFNDFMLDHGFTRLGEGAFAAVYEKPGYPWVFKVFHGDPAYLDFLQYALKHQNNPHVPRFKGRPFKITHNTYAIRMEKLSHEFKNIDDIMNLINRWKSGPLTAAQEEYLRDVNMPQMIPLLNDLKNLAKARRHMLDIHKGNVMARGDILVIVDPLVNYGALTGDPNS